MDANSLSHSQGSECDDEQDVNVDDLYTSDCDDNVEYDNYDEYSSHRSNRSVRSAKTSNDRVYSDRALALIEAHKRGGSQHNSAHLIEAHPRGGMYNSARELYKSDSAIRKKAPRPRRESSERNIGGPSRECPPCLSA